MYAPERMSRTPLSELTNLGILGGTGLCAPQILTDRGHHLGQVQVVQTLSGRSEGLWPRAAVSGSSQQAVADVTPQSAFSRHLASQKDRKEPDESIKGSLEELVDPVLRSMHRQSQKYRPNATALLESIDSAHRQDTLAWLLQAFDIMHFSDSLLYTTMLVLDRFYSVPPPNSGGPGAAQQRLLGAICMALKTSSPADQSLPLKQIINHLSHDQVKFDAVLMTELSMLRLLQFNALAPSAHDFLEALSYRLINVPITASGGNAGVTDALMWSNLSEFLLQLTLADAHLHYRYPHAVLAASAIVLALWAVRAPATAYEVVLEDLSNMSPDDQPPNNPVASGKIVQCVATVHRLWIRSSGGLENGVFYRHLHAKFRRAANRAASTVTPPVTPPARIPPPPPAPVQRTTLRDYQYVVNRESRGGSTTDSRNRAASWNGRRRPPPRIIPGSP